MKNFISLIKNYIFSTEIEQLIDKVVITNSNYKEYINDTWWNSLSQNWRDLFIANIKANNLDKSNNLYDNIFNLKMLYCE